jgi:hypothetical protein
MHVHIYINNKTTFKNKFGFFLNFLLRRERKEKKKNFFDVLNSATSKNSNVALFKTSKKFFN